MVRELQSREGEGESFGTRILSGRLGEETFLSPCRELNPDFSVVQPAVYKHGLYHKNVISYHSSCNRNFKVVFLLTLFTVLLSLVLVAQVL